jgi:sugar-specific transcriptional regulator TrmB
MAKDFQMELQELGLMPTEAQIYLALVRNGALGGSAIASVTGFPRSTVYLALNALAGRGLVEAGTGRGSRFHVVSPDKALPALIAQEREAISQREKAAAELGRQFFSLLEKTDTGPDELVQVIRSPRGVAARYERLQIEATEQIEGFVKAPLFVTPGNPVQKSVQRRGVRFKALYERAVLDNPQVRPYLDHWMSLGEEVRIYAGELPHKLAIFDRKVVLAHLNIPGDRMRTLCIRHPELAQSLGIAFETLWNQSERLEPSSSKRMSSKARLVPVVSDLAVDGYDRAVNGERRSRSK